jgi:hypothetical protein
MTFSLRAEVPDREDRYVQCVEHQRLENQLN